jgi:hypothetical protein
MMRQMGVQPIQKLFFLQMQPKNSSVRHYFIPESVVFFSRHKLYKYSCWL